MCIDGFLFVVECGEKSDDEIKTFKRVKMGIYYKCTRGYLMEDITDY